MSTLFIQSMPPGDPLTSPESQYLLRIRPVLDLAMIMNIMTLLLKISNNKNENLQQKEDYVNIYLCT